MSNLENALEQLEANYVQMHDETKESEGKQSSIIITCPA